jgi:pimeloyl-ACP methyl ester carboxylesterase
VNPPNADFLVATAVKEVEFKDTGHWLMEERPEKTIDALVAFL